ncbi:MAG: C39 family peptidase [Vicinamibacterales bacterium]
MATAVCLLALLAPPAFGQARSGPEVTPRSASTALLDVPYLPQTERLCGGAALAMVMRYWGATDVYPEDFASLVDRDHGGIHAADLVGAARTRGWTTAPALAPAATAAATLAREIARGRPVIALVEDRPGAFHYVVVVAATATEVVVHDPARAPFLVIPIARFERQWSASDRWMLVLLPAVETATVAPGRRTLSPARVPAGVEAGTEVEADSVEGPDRPTTGAVCGRLVDQAVALARTGAVDDAARGLEAATALCPADPAGWRELAGLRFTEHRWRDAAALAARADALAPGDAYTTDLVATSRFLAGDDVGALAAWNRTGTPTVGVVAITGARRTRQRVLLERLDLRPRRLLTPGAFTRARRRLAALPTATSTALRYAPAEVIATEPAAGPRTASIEAAVTERPLLPSRWPDWAAIGATAAARREVRLDVAGPSGGGDVWSGTFRWMSERPRIGFAIEMPGPGWMPGIVRIDAGWERQAYAGGTREARRHAGLSFTDWATGTLRWNAGAGYDRIGERRFGTVSGALDQRWFDDRLSWRGAAGAWAGTGPAFASSSTALAWRSSRTWSAPAWSAHGGVTIATSRAPFAVWPGAGEGLARPALLRAHPLLEDGVIAGEAFGRRLAFATAEYSRPVWRGVLAGLDLVGFVDAARAWARRTGDASPLLVDAGAGIRLRSPASDLGVRLDVAYGLRDRSSAVTVRIEHRGWRE